MIGLFLVRAERMGLWVDARMDAPGHGCVDGYMDGCIDPLTAGSVPHFQMTSHGSLFPPSGRGWIGLLIGGIIHRNHPPESSAGIIRRNYPPELSMNICSEPIYPFPLAASFQEIPRSTLSENPATPRENP